MNIEPLEDTGRTCLSIVFFSVYVSLLIGGSKQEEPFYLVSGFEGINLRCACVLNVVHAYVFVGRV